MIGTVVLENRWPMLGRHARAAGWLRLRADLGRGSPNDRRLHEWAPNISGVRAGGCRSAHATRAHIGIYVRELTERLSLQGLDVVSIDSGSGLANVTTAQGLASVRLFCDHLMDTFMAEGLRESTPVGRGRYTRLRRRVGTSVGLCRGLAELPWIPTEQRWEDILKVAAAEPVRNFGDARPGLRRSITP